MTNGEFQERVRLSRQRLYGMAYMLLGTQADCEDAVQEALMKAVEPVAQEMYSSAQPGAAGAQPGANPEPPPAGEPKKEKGGDDVVDADFTMK